MIPEEISGFVSNWLISNINPACRITGFSTLYGGSINNNFAVTTTTGNYFLKYNKSSEYPEMFRKERMGLELLASTNTVYVPEVLLDAETINYGFLVMKLQKQVNPVARYWEILGIQLAELHRNKAPGFGLDYDNYIGSLKQSNTRHPSYIEFFIKERLEPLLKTAYEKKLLNNNDASHFSSLYKKLAEILPEEEPSLIHGDLWSGNLIVSSEGFPCIIDPAIYYGHRESDLAMSKLFGGFSPLFYRSYNETYPLFPGWEERIRIHQLYPLLVHVNLFGGSYATSIREIIRVF